MAVSAILNLNKGNITIKNGKIQNLKDTKNGIILHGDASLKLKNVKIHTKDTAIRAYDGSKVSLDKDCDVRTTDAIAALIVWGQPGYEETKPTIDIDCPVTSKYYCVAGNGTDTIGTVVNITKNARLNSQMAPAIFHPQNGVLNIYGGRVTGYDGLYVKAGKVNISGGTIKGTLTGSQKYLYNGSGCNEIGNGITVDFAGYPSGDPVLNITGGSILSSDKKAVEVYLPKEKKNNSEGYCSADNNETLAAKIATNIHIMGGEFTPSLNKELL